MRTWLLVLAACAGTSKHEPLIWSAPIEIAAGGGQKGPWQQNNSDFDYVDDPTIAFDPRGYAVVAWVDNKAKDVLVQRFAVDGPRGAPVNVSRTPAVFSWLPRIVISPHDPERVFVLWQEIVFSGGSHGGDMFFARSLDGGATFATPLNLSSSRNGDGKARLDADTWLNGSLDLAADNSMLYAAWTDYEGTLWFARSTDDGESFSPPLPIAGDRARPARAPALATAGGLIYLAWTLGEDPRADIHLATSTDGSTFSPAAIVAATPGYSDAPKLAVDRDGALHVVYAEANGAAGEPAHIRYLRSHDHGRTFNSAREMLHPAGAESAGFPSLAIDVDRVVVTWELYPDVRRPPRGLVIAVSTDGGNSFSSPSVVPGSADPIGGDNGSHQGRLMRKLAVQGGAIALVNSALRHGARSRVWLLRGRLR